jgi:hypothetical protein
MAVLPSGQQTQRTTGQTRARHNLPAQLAAKGLLFTVFAQEDCRLYRRGWPRVEMHANTELEFASRGVIIGLVCR